MPMDALRFSSCEVRPISVSGLCHIPRKPWGKTVIDGDTSRQIVVAGSC